jgi:hypothetical protein
VLWANIGLFRLAVRGCLVAVLETVLNLQDLMQDLMVCQRTCKSCKMFGPQCFELYKHERERERDQFA